MNKTIVVTGASRGIGRSIALAFADTHANLVINCVKNEALLLELKKEIESKGARCACFVGDIGIFDNARKMFELAHETFGKVDVLVNNAGISSIGLFQDLSPDEWNNIMSTNIGSVYNCCHLAIPDMLSKHSGKIINISSVWGIVGASCEVAYSASKGALNSLTRALAKELAPSNIQVNAIACGAIDTDMNSCFSADELDSLANEIPAGRMGSPDEVARTVILLADSCSYLTGQVIRLDGGWI